MRLLRDSVDYPIDRMFPKANSTKELFMPKILIPAFAMTAILVCLPHQAEASHRSELAEAASCYRRAAFHFGHEVVAQPHLTAFEKRLAPELVRLSGHLEGLARHPHQLYRLQEAAWELARLHDRVEAVLFGHPGCPVYVALRPCWEEVLCAYRDLRRELLSIGCHQGHPHGHASHLPAVIPTHPALGYPGYGNQQPQAGLPSYRYRSEPVRSYRYGNASRSGSDHSSSYRSPSEQQLREVEKRVERERGRQTVDLGQIGAILSRRLSSGF